MTLPYELLQYAENFYRRFPEEFIALGAPGLEEIYDLRPHSTLTRRIQDTPNEKSVEITLRRWYTPPVHTGGSLSHGLGYTQASSYAPPPHLSHLAAAGMLQQQAAKSSTAAGPYGHSPYSGYNGMAAYGPPMALPPAAPSAAPPRWEAELNSRLSRLEGALSSLKPQIEVLLSKPQQALHQEQYFKAHQHSASQFAGSSDDAAVQQVPVSPYSGTSDRGMTRSNSLANRRGAAGLAIETAPTKPQAKPTEAIKPVATQAAGTKPNGSSSPTNAKGLSINPCRVAPGLQDPQSPRSPGRYTAWK